MPPEAGQEPVVYARSTVELDAREHAALLESPHEVKRMREAILQGDVFVARGVFPREKLEPIRDYLAGVGGASLPNYQPITESSPNFHRMNRWDPRSYVRGCFHQFSFFPWNQDPFDLFALLRPVFRVKNLLSGLDVDRFLGLRPEEGCAARLSFQFYPRGNGALNLHTDPRDHHQLAVPVALLSRKGEDFQNGGAFVERRSGERIHLDDAMDWGDVAYFHAQMPHGVEMIDPDAELDWLSFQGRWMVIFAINKLQGNDSVPDSRDLEGGEA